MHEREAAVMRGRVGGLADDGDPAWAFVEGEPGSEDLGERVSRVAHSEIMIAEIAAGVTPEMRAACPSVRGATRVSFWRTSAVRPWTPP